MEAGSEPIPSQSGARYEAPMTNRRARITQAEVARILRAARQAGASEVEVKLGEQSVIVKLSTGQLKTLEPDEEIVL
jgi:hypothetical protein